MQRFGSNTFGEHCRFQDAVQFLSFRETRLAVTIRG